MNSQEMIRISVRSLVEFILREGDIDNRRVAVADKEAMQLGSRIHRKIQRQMGSVYRAEVPLQRKIPCDGFSLQIEGRADGIFEEQNVEWIDEIKGVYRDVHKMEEPIGVHLAQAKCYAYIYAKEQDLETIGVQMTYYQMETEEIKRFQTLLQTEELENWFLMIVKEYEKWAKLQAGWKKERDDSIRKVEFPYQYREGQKEVVTSVYKTILRKKKLFIQAPTGVGKTMATIFPTVKAIGEGLGDRLFYLTAKTITRTVAEKAFGYLRDNGLRMKILTLTAKEKICFCEETECNPDACPYAKGHFDRVNDAVYDVVTTELNINREIIEQYAKKHDVCPFEFSLDVSLWVDSVICDYNYAFDPDAHLKRFFSEGKNGDYLFLVDEAHNLVERGREMYSATLYKEAFLHVKRKVKGIYTKLERHLDGCNRIMLEWKRECENYQVQSNISHFVLKLMNVYSGMEELLEEGVEFDEEWLDFYFDVRSFLSIYEELDENYVIYTELEPNGEFKVKLYCVNPATKLDRFLSQGNSTIFFSATMLPIHYYKELLSVSKDDYAIYAHSPFKSEQRLLLVGGDVSTRYTSRGIGMYKKYSQYIETIIKCKQGNYLVFFPSYRFMESVWQEFIAYKGDDIECVLQDANMDEEKREAFLNHFHQEREGTLLGFCVLGGVFSEGIDLTKDRLIGAIVIGTGLPQVCHEREILKTYFDEHKVNGFEYAYLYPAMNKVQQAAGRVIRTEQDKGIIVLLDERFLGKQYQDTFPREWSDWKRCKLDTLKSEIEGFWKEIK